MADAQQGRPAGNNAKPKEPKKKKKNSTSVKLPNARKSIIRQRRMAQGKAEYNGIFDLAAAAVIVALILFILFGGINQRKFVETMGRWSKTIGQKFQQIVHPDNVIINDDGVYYDVDGDGNPG